MTNNKRLNKLLTAVFAMVLMLAFMGIGVMADSVTVGDEKSLNDAVEAGIENIKLNAHIQLTSHLVIDKDTTYTLDLNGKTLRITRPATNNKGSVIYIDNEDADVIITDTSPEKNGSITNGSGDEVEGIYYGGGIFINKGRCVLKNGSIRGNAAHLGGGVYINENATFEMEGGFISGNQVASGRIRVFGSGIYNAGSFKMSGGVISGHTSSTNTYNDPTGVYLAESGTMTMTGGRIVDNTTDVKVTGQKKLTLSGNPVIGLLDVTKGETANYIVNMIWVSKL